MAVAVYPGSFDPVTLGHYDIIERTSKIMDRVILGVLNNNSKSPLFSVEERVNMIKSITSHLDVYKRQVSLLRGPFLITLPIPGKPF